MCTESFHDFLTVSSAFVSHDGQFRETIFTGYKLHPLDPLTHNHSCIDWQTPGRLGILLGVFISVAVGVFLLMAINAKLLRKHWFRGYCCSSI